MTLSACETALGRDSGGEGFVGFTQALLMSGTRSVCLSLWKVDDKATALLDAAVLRQSAGPPPRALEADAQGRGAARGQGWLRGLTAEEVDQAWKPHSRGGIVTTTEKPVGTHPYEHPYYLGGVCSGGRPELDLGRCQLFLSLRGSCFHVHLSLLGIWPSRRLSSSGFPGEFDHGGNGPIARGSGETGRIGARTIDASWSSKPRPLHHRPAKRRSGTIKLMATT